MININEKIKNIGEYFKGMNVAEGFIYITVCFPDGWKVSNRLEEKYDDLLALAIQHPSFFQQYEYILWDEVQDSNSLEFEFIIKAP